MKISILTLFPQMFAGPFEHSIIKRAQDKKLLEIEYINIRDFADDRYKTVDDRPYGGGIGMVMKVDVLHRALQAIKKDLQPTTYKLQARVVLLDPKGTPFTQSKAQEYCDLDHLILICGHYEGVDARIATYIDESLSIGPFVLTGGELPAMVVADAVTRLIPGVLPHGATTDESFNAQNTLEYPHYTRPEEYEGQKVPDVLLSGNHKEIEKWRRQQKTRITKLEARNKFK